MPAIDTSPQEQAAAEALTNANTLALQVAAFKVTDDASMQDAADAIKELRDRRKELEAERDSVAKPLRAAASKISGWFKRPIERFEAMETYLRGEIKAYHDAQAEAARAQLAAAASPAEVEQAVAVVAPAPQGLHFRENWSARVVDRSKLPPEYLIVDQQRLDREARALKHSFAVPGVEAVVERKPVVR